jgi:phosphoglycolate phosphatase-like HAD superfamily hydrolase
LLNDAAARAGITIDDTQRRRFHDRYCELLETEILHPGPRKGLMPGVEPLLANLDQRDDVAVALLTGNFARSAQIKLEHFGLWRFFLCGAFADDSSDRDRLVPVAVARAAGVGVIPASPADVVVIGDTPLDIQCARVAGAQSIAVATGSFDQDTLNTHGASAVLPDLGDADAFLDALQRLTQYA